VPERRRAEVIELAALINEQLWSAISTWWINDGIIISVMRWCSPAASAADASARLCSASH